jgi:hypothetical protein
VRINGSSVEPELEHPYVVGSAFGWMIEINDGIASDYARGDDPLPSTPVIAGELEANGSSSWYFKAGAYAQSNADEGDPEEYVAVELRDLRTEHIAR